MKASRSIAVACAVTASVSGHALAQSILQVELIAAEGQSPPGAPKGSVIASLNAPFTNGEGKVGFTGNLNPSNNFVWYDTGIIWLNSDGSPDVLTGTEGTMGISNSGGFIYSPSVNGNDAVWGSDGLILQETDPAPGLLGMFSSFNSRPTMTPFNIAHWIGGYTDTLGGATDGRVFYRRTADSGQIILLLKTGDVVGGLTISTTIGFDYDVSDNAEYYIVVCDTTAATSADEVVILNDAIVLREGDPTGQGDNWQAFDLVSVNNDGNWIVTGDTNGATASDEFIAYNGQIVVREGDTLDGVLLASGWALRAASINNLNRVAHIWGLSDNEAIFVGDGPTLGTSSVKIAATGDAVDFNGDNIADATIVDFVASATISPGVWFSDHNHVYVEVDLIDDANVEYEAIIKLSIPGVKVPCPADINGSGSVDVADLLAVITAWGPCGDPNNCPADINGDDMVNVGDLLAVINAWGACE